MTGQREGRRTAAALALALTIAGCGGPDIADERIDLAACRSLRLVDGEDRPVVGIENMAILPEADALLLSAYDRRAVEAAIAEGDARLPTGGLYRIALAGLVAGRNEAMRLAGPVGRPHGFALGGEPGARRVAVIERRYLREEDEWTLAPQLVEASLAPDGSALMAPHIIDFPEEICAPNDLDQSPDGLFISNDHRDCRGMARLLEDVFALDGGALYRYRDGSFGQRRAGLAYANGVAFDPAREAVLVAETRARAIGILPLDDAVPEPPAIALDAAPDSLSFDPDGRLYVAAHPDLFAYAAFRGGWFGRDSAPSRVYRIDRGPDGAARVALVFDDPEGRLVSGATGVAATGALLLVSGGYDDRIALCRLDSGEPQP